MRKQSLFLLALLLTSLATLCAQTPDTNNLPARPPGVDERRWRVALEGTEDLLSHNGPVEFHARALDQDAQPVPGVSLEVEVARYDRMRLLGLDRSSKDTSVREDLTLRSDAQGWFHLSGKTGHVLKIKSAQKVGYVWESDIYLHYDYMPKYMLSNAPYADAKQGVVFHLWRKGQTEPLVPVDRNMILGGSSRNYSISFLPTSTQSSDPDWLVKVEYLMPENSTNRYDQRITIQALRGGILEAPAAHYPYVAPMEGYQPSFSFLYRPDDPTRSGGGWERRFFTRLRDGKAFGGFVVKFSPAPFKAVQISGHVNPHGSRLLEPDPAKLITDPAEIRRLDEATRSR